MVGDARRGPGRVKIKEFISSITYVSCDEVEQTYNTKKIRGEAIVVHTNMNYLYLVIGVLSGVILSLILAIVAYFSVKRCKNQTQNQVLKHFGLL